MEAPLDLDGLAELARRASDGPLAHTAFTLAANPSTVLRLIEAARLGVAWQEAEEALPEGWRWMGVSRRPDVALELSGQDESRRWRASIWHPDSGDKPISGDGPTPAAALKALAAKLREADR